MTAFGPFKFIQPDNTITAALSGTLVDGLNESQVRTGSAAVTITLTGGTWVSAGAAFDAVRQDIIDGITGSVAWNTNVRDNIPVTSVTRVGDEVVSVQMNDVIYIDYQISVADNITVEVPASATSGAAAIVAAPAITVAELSGAAVDYVGEVSQILTQLGRSSVFTFNVTMGSAAEAKDFYDFPGGIVYLPSINQYIDFSLATTLQIGTTQAQAHVGPGATDFDNSMYSLIIFSAYPTTFNVRFVLRVGDNHPTLDQANYWTNEGVAAGDVFGFDHG